MAENLNLTCYEYLKKCVADLGDYTAAVTFKHKISMKTLMSDIDSIADYLTGCGVTAGDVVTVFLPTTVHCFAAFYAINKVGAIANIVHPLSPPEQLLETARQTKAKVLFILDLLAEKYSDVIEELAIPCVICSNSDYVGNALRPFIRIYERKNSNMRVCRGQYCVPYRKALEMGRGAGHSDMAHNGRKIAVYLHGGGTTGKSKTIMLSSNAINAIARKLENLDRPHKPGSEYSLVVLPMFHAFGLAIAMHYSLTHGFTCLPVPKFSAQECNKLIKDYPVSFIVGVPDMFRKMYEEDSFEGKHLKNLRLLFCGGDFVAEKFLEQFNDKLAEYGSEGKLFRGYGLTEASSVCCVNTYDECCPESIGKPLEGIKIEIWDEMRRKVPANEIGEIVVSGDTLMEGYYNGDKTVSNDGVYTDASGRRWVLTGDLGYKDSKGFIFFTGRKKRMIIISGYNVYPTDIENTVLELDFVKEACAVQGYHKGKPLAKLCVTVVEGTDKDKAISQINSYCKKKLSKFSCPKKIEIIDEMPRTKMAKIDFMKLCDSFPTGEIKDKPERKSNK